MKLIRNISNRVKKFVSSHGNTFSKLFVWIYASVFVCCGLLTIAGVLVEFCSKGTVNYSAVNAFVREYFAPSIAGTFAILGVLLIDRDNDGVPDKWQQDVDNKDGEENGKHGSGRRHDS